MATDENWEAVLNGFVDTINSVLTVCAGDGKVPPAIAKAAQSCVDWARTQADAMVAAATAGDVVKSDGGFNFIRDLGLENLDPEMIVTGLDNLLRKSRPIVSI